MEFLATPFGITFVILITLVSFLGLFGGIYWAWIERKKVAELVELAATQQLTISKARRVNRVMAPAGLKIDPRSVTGCLFYRVFLREESGRGRTGWARLALNQNRFAAPPLLKIDSLGPSFDDID